MILLRVRHVAALLRQCCSRRSYRCISVRGISSGTVDEDEVTRFNQFASDWWGSTGRDEFATLHAMNRLRVPLVRDAVIRQHAATSKSLPKALDSSTPLAGMKILDVGCGGGILSEPIARLGAEVTGIDASSELIRVADWHASLDSDVRDRVTYRISSIEELCSNDEPVQLYDGVIASEIVEHVSDAELFVRSCCSLVKPGGSIFFTTISRTWCSYAAAIVAAEDLLRIVPRGVHDWNKFVLPEELKHLVIQNGFSVRLIHGMMLNPIAMSWSWITNTSVNYALHAVKLAVRSTDS